MNWKQLLSQKRPCIPHEDPLAGNDLRSEFEKDYHRIIISAAFRRLQDKTQVFPLDQSDFIRTRLTHSLEVSSIARSLGQNISQYLIKNQKDPDFTYQSMNDVCSIVQCAGLIHDIGNPPFGHFGETTIRDWFRTKLPEYTLNGTPLSEILTEQMKADLFQFEGNAQALRLLTKLHFLVDENGMNLTYALLSTIIKYPVSSLKIDPASGNIKDKKPGYYLAEEETFAEIQREVGTNGSRHPLCYILEAADDIAYLTADIEDGFKKGFLGYHRLYRDLTQNPNKEKLPADEQKAYLDMIDKLSFLYETGLKKDVPDPDEYAISNWILEVQHFLIGCSAKGFTDHYDEIMAGTYPSDLFSGTTGKEIHDILGRIAFDRVFTTQSIYKTEITAATVLNYLLDTFMAAAIRFDTDERLTDVQEKLMILITDNYKQVYFRESEGKTEAEKLYLRILLVTDYICGMTDSYARRLYQEMNGLI